MKRAPLFEAALTNRDFAAIGPGASAPADENQPDALLRLHEENARWRQQPWPEPYNRTQHRLHLGGARHVPWVESESVHLVVTSPPYWALKKYNDHPDQLGYIEDYEVFLEELDKVWRECARVLVPGGRICCVVGDVCIPRRKNKGRHWVAPLHSDIQVRARKLRLDNLAPIIWHKISNGAQEATGNGRAYYGKPYQPNGVIKNDIEYILFLRKGGHYRNPTHIQKVLSMLTKDEQRKWYQQIWSDVRGASTRTGHPAPYPVELASRLIRMFSFAGDTVFDPFVGTGSTSTAAVREGRNSIGNEIDPAYFNQAWVSVISEANVTRSFGPVFAEVVRVE